MGYTHFKGVSVTESGLAVGEANAERVVVDTSGNVNVLGTITPGLNVATRTIGYSAGTVNISVPALSIVTDVIIKVGTAYTGSGTIDIGDASDADGFLPNASITKTAGAVSGGTVTARGAYLYDSTNKKLVKLYPTATNVVVTIGSGFTAGSATVYVVYAKLA